MTHLNLTAASLELFTALYADADNWGGQPLFGGNVGGSKADRGNLTDLKTKGLLETMDDDGIWVSFTEAGHEFAKTLNEAPEAAPVSNLEMLATLAGIATKKETNTMFDLTISSAAGLFFTATVEAADAGAAIKLGRAAVREAGISRKVGTINYLATKA